MKNISNFKAADIEVNAPVRPIAGLLPGMELIGHNLPTNHCTPPKCLVLLNNYVREYILIRSGESYEPLDVPEAIWNLAEFNQKPAIRLG